MIALLLVIGGLVVLVLGGNMLVRGASNLALKLRLPPMLVGMTVVAMGTSSPELVVSLQAALEGNADIAIGNVVGSNIANIALILGLTVMIFPLRVKPASLKVDWLAMMLATLLIYFFAFNGQIGRLEGMLSVACLAGFIYFSFRRDMRLRKSTPELPDVAQLSGWVNRYEVLVGFIVVGCTGLIFGASWFLDGAKLIALSLGLSDRVIGLTLVAFGTSVPELATSVIAAFKREEDISLGNIVGSNLFNLLGILGITAAIEPIEVSQTMVDVDFWWMIAAAVLLFVLARPAYHLNRWSGLVLLLVYGVFMYFQLSTPAI